MSRAAQISERIDKRAAAAILGCSPATVVIMAARGDLAKAGAAKICGKWTFDEKRLRVFAQEPRKLKKPRPFHEHGEIYIIGFNSYVKIGFSSDHKRRIAGIQSSVPVKLTVYKIIPNIKAPLELVLHERFSSYQLLGEWFSKEGELAVWIEAGCPL